MDKILNDFTSLVRKAVDEYHMIDDGETVAVGVSGGKDSMLLLRSLQHLSTYYPKRFQVEAVTVELGFEGMDFAPVADMCRELDIPYTCLKTDIKEIVFDVRQEDNPCSLCAKMRRGALNDAIRARGISKLALGHHFDDAVETFMYDVTAGEVLVGGKDVRTYDVETLRQNVSVVLQNNVLFSGTILENLRWGSENADEEDCAEACRLACADEFISKMPEGYNTRIEQGGTNISGGQKQRLCIARALLMHPKILILDDSTSAVDTATDAKIRKAFAQHIPNTTKLIISQRVASVQDADKILVLDNGTVNGFGTHAQLMASNAIYRDVYESQTSGSGDFDERGED